MFRYAKIPHFIKISHLSCFVLKNIPYRAVYCTHLFSTKSVEMINFPENVMMAFYGSKLCITYKQIPKKS